MEEYKPNSHKAKAEAANTEKKVDKVVSGKVISKKKSGVSKVADNFISDDIHNVKDYVLMDVLIPAAKKAISDIVTNGIDMILYGEAGRPNKKSTPYVSYNRFSDSRSYRRDDERPRSRASGYSHDDIILESRGEAEEVLDSMEALIDNYGMVSVADLYDLVGITGEYTDNKYGWTSLRSAEAIRVRDGYMLKLPRAVPL